MDEILIAQAQPEAAPAPPPAAPPPATPGTPSETTGTQQPQKRMDDSSAFTGQLLMFGAIFVVFWLVLIRPQRKREQERLARIDKLQRNDSVMTSSGILGTVHSIKDNVVVLKVDEDKDVKIRVTKNSVVPVDLPKDGERKPS